MGRFGITLAVAVVAVFGASFSVHASDDTAPVPHETIGALAGMYTFGVDVPAIAASR